MRRFIGFAPLITLGVLAGPALAAWSGDIQNPLPICTANGGQITPQAATDGSGGMIVAWWDERSTGRGIYAQRVSDAGEPLWTTNGVLLSSLGVNAFEPIVVSDDAGGAIIGWYDYRDYPAVYVQRVGPNGIPQWAPTGVAIGPDASGGQGQFAVCPDGASGAIVVWQSDIEFIALARRISAAGVIQWPSPTVVGDYMNACAAAPDGMGGAVVASDGGGVAWVQRVDHDGLARWGPFGTSLGTSRLGARPAVVGDGAGGGTVAWDANPGVSVEGLLADGSTRYAAQLEYRQLEVARANSVQLVSSTDGDVVAGWVVPVPGPIEIHQLLAQRLNGFGETQWAPASGVLLCDSTFVSRLTSSPDETGGALFGFASRGFPTAFVNRVDGSGAIWSKRPGAGISGSSTTALTMVADGAQGALVAWQRGLATQADINGQRVLSNGDLADTPVPTLWSIASTDVSVDEVRLTWHSPAASHAEIEIQRAIVDGDWRTLTVASAHADGFIVVEDRDVVPGTRYGYRLVDPETRRPIATSEQWITVPERLALGLRPLANPATREITAVIALPRASQVTVTLTDVAGRRVASRVLDLPSGEQTVSLGSARQLESGVYLLGLENGGVRRTARVCVVR